MDHFDDIVQRQRLEHRRRASVARSLLDACADEYLNALQSGRTAEWATMAHSMIEVLAGGELSRSEQGKEKR